MLPLIPTFVPKAAKDVYADVSCPNPGSVPLEFRGSVPVRLNAGSCSQLSKMENEFTV